MQISTFYPIPHCLRNSQGYYLDTLKDSINKKNEKLALFIFKKINKKWHIVPKESTNLLKLLIEKKDTTAASEVFKAIKSTLTPEMKRQAKEFIGKPFEPSKGSESSIVESSITESSAISSTKLETPNQLKWVESKDRKPSTLSERYELRRRWKENAQRYAPLPTTSELEWAEWKNSKPSTASKKYDLGWR